VTRRILVVDDNPDMRTSLVLVLQHLGHEAREASSGDEALSCIAEWRPQIALVDLDMPGMTGVEICERARRSTAGRDTTFVALTGWVGEGPRARALAAGFARHVVKPLTMAELQELIDTLHVSILPHHPDDVPPRSAPTASANHPSSLNHPQQDDHDGNDQQHVNESSHGVGGYEAEQPEDNENNGKSRKHGGSPNTTKD
jgi:CheY-like chemotaxis protein